MLEDNATDAEIIRRVILKEHPGCEFHLAMTKDAYLLALDQFMPDIILADNSLPQFDARDALRIIRDRSLTIPFIMVTGTVSEEFAVETIKAGADDYLLKDRINRLPAAIETAITQRKTQKEKQGVLEEIRISNERFKILSKATKDAIWDWDLLTGRVWGNEGFFDLLGFNQDQPIPPPYEWSNHIHPADREKLFARLQEITKSKVSYWEDALRFQSALGMFETVLDRAFVLKDDAGNPVRVVGVFVDVTSNIEQQRAITRTILQTQEMERNALGRELHDNINQIMASINLKLGYYLEEPEDNLEIVEHCRRDLRKAIEECRKLSHNMVIPRFAEHTLREELDLLIESYRTRQMVWLNSDGFQEENIPSTIKENLFRIAQEQLSNIQKHAKASEIGIQLRNDSKSVGLLIQDNGVGFDIGQKRKGIGITNIFNRAESYNGTAEIFSQPGKGCTLSVKIPLALQSG